ncbi:MAG TPA: hypothetical protein VK832_02630, partial [Burkholderiaceae bacterium]|nr:hypothetical protein [Burkholderiaceae bacterium]
EYIKGNNFDVAGNLLRVQVVHRLYFEESKILILSQRSKTSIPTRTCRGGHADAGFFVHFCVYWQFSPEVSDDFPSLAYIACSHDIDVWRRQRSTNEAPGNST